MSCRCSKKKGASIQVQPCVIKKPTNFLELHFSHPGILLDIFFRRGSLSLTLPWSIEWEKEPATSQQCFSCMICELPRKINPRAAARDYEVFIRVGTKREILPDGDKSVRALHWPFKAAAASENFFVLQQHNPSGWWFICSDLFICPIVALFVCLNQKQFQARDNSFAPETDENL